MPDVAPAAAPAAAPPAAPPAAPAATAPPPAPATAPAPQTPPAGAGGTEPDFVGSDAPPKDGPGSQPPPAAEELRVTLPEGVTLDKQTWDAFVPLAKEIGLKSEGAQKLVDLLVQRDASRAAASDVEWQKQVQTWRSQILTDPDLGGPNLKVTELASRRAVEHGGGKELRALLNETGLGNHPVVVRALVRFGKLLNEDSIAGGAPSTPEAPKSLEERLGYTESMKGK